MNDGSGTSVHACSVSHHFDTNALLALQVEEFYVITWDAKKEQVFEMPTGGAAIMRQGPNLLKLARKEQCLAVLTQLRNKFKTDGQIYRVFPDGEVQYLHPKDGVYPEKVNAGREAVGANDRSIGKNPQPVSVRPLLWLMCGFPCQCTVADPLGCAPLAELLPAVLQIKFTGKLGTYDA